VRASWQSSSSREPKTSAGGSLRTLARRLRAVTRLAGNGADWLGGARTGVDPVVQVIKSFYSDIDENKIIQYLELYSIKIMVFELNQFGGLAVELPAF
jgi:hypothetical protein